MKKPQYAKETQLTIHLACNELQRLEWLFFPFFLPLYKFQIISKLLLSIKYRTFIYTLHKTWSVKLPKSRKIHTKSCTLLLKQRFLTIFDTYCENHSPLWQIITKIFYIPLFSYHFVFCRANKNTMKIAFEWWRQNTNGQLPRTFRYVKTQTKILFTGFKRENLKRKKLKFTYHVHMEKMFQHLCLNKGLFWLKSHAVHSPSRERQHC